MVRQLIPSAFFASGQPGRLVASAGGQLERSPAIVPHLRLRESREAAAEPPPCHQEDAQQRLAGNIVHQVSLICLFEAYRVEK